MGATIEGEGTLEKSTLACFFWPILRGIALIAALYFFLDFLLDFLTERKLPYPNGGAWESWEPAMLVFTVASLTVMATVPKESGAKRSGTLWWRRLPDWSLVIYTLVLGLGFNWACAFLWFSRKHALFSVPVIGVAALIVASYALLGLLVARLSGGNWRTAVLVFSCAPCAVSGMVLRLGLLR